MKIIFGTPRLSYAFWPSLDNIYDNCYTCYNAELTVGNFIKIYKA